MQATRVLVVMIMFFTVIGFQMFLALNEVSDNSTSLISLVMGALIIKVADGIPMITGSNQIREMRNRIAALEHRIELSSQENAALREQNEMVKQMLADVHKNMVRQMNIGMAGS